MELPSVIKDKCVRFEPVGSRVTCDPPPLDTDQDYLVLVDEEDAEAVFSLLSTIGYALDGSDPGDAFNVADEGCFQSYSYSDVNLIITADESFFGRFMAASSVAKRLNLLDKADRIALFQAVLYGNRCDVPAPFEEIN